MLYFTYTRSYVGIMFGDSWSDVFFVRRLRLAHFLMEGAKKLWQITKAYTFCVQYNS